MKTCPNCQELLGDGVAKCFNCGWDFEHPEENEKAKERERIRLENIKKAEEERKRLEEEMERNRIVRQREEMEAKLRRQQEHNQAVLLCNPVYEYDVQYVYDKASGAANIEEIQRLLNDYASKRWRLHTIYVNELGKNSSSVSIGGASSGTNATIDQTVLIFERQIQKVGE